MLRAQIATDLTVTAFFYGEDEETLTNADGAVTVTVTRADGTALAGGSASTPETGVYTFKLTSAVHLSEYDILTVNFSGIVSSFASSDDYFIKVVGKRFFKIAALRDLPGLGDTAVFTNERLKEMRDVAEDFVEDTTLVAWVPQYRREIYDGENLNHIFVNRIPARSIHKVVIDDVVQDTSGWTISGEGRILTSTTSFASSTVGQNVEIQYITGHDVPNGDLVNATLRLARHLTLNFESAIPDRARMMQTEWGLFHLDTANKEHPTGLPEVDAILTRYTHEQPVTIV